MARPEDIGQQFERLFHGSPNFIKLGGTVNPHQLHGSGDEPEAFATPHPEVARGYAGEDGYVHEVKPIENDDTLSVVSKGQVVTSGKGFTVVKSTPMKNEETWSDEPFEGSKRYFMGTKTLPGEKEKPEDLIYSHYSVKHNAVNPDGSVDSHEGYSYECGKCNG
jgi:hypothetical protein